MKEKIELQIADLAEQSNVTHQAYLATMQDINAQIEKLQLALIYATDKTPDIQAILDEVK